MKQKKVICIATIISFLVVLCFGNHSANAQSTGLFSNEDTPTQEQIYSEMNDIMRMQNEVA